MENSIIVRLQSFKEWFRGYEDNFIVIGGAACSLILDEHGAEFRATKDVDVVLFIEALSVDFGIIMTISLQFNICFIKSSPNWGYSVKVHIYEIAPLATKSPLNSLNLVKLCGFFINFNKKC